MSSEEYQLGMQNPQWDDYDDTLHSPGCVCGYMAGTDDDLTEHILAMARIDGKDHAEA